ncbi:CKLF-like MARVEL transmembrane domain-containing protein 4 [Exaiptasia diaphana]|nr:CKLF-like MARVEL transmembrane domain-containing protein 4 [Exaiptasia diaphana]
MMEDDQGASPQYNHQEDTGSTGTIDTRYIISKFGILKILEIILLLIAFASLTGYTGQTPTDQDKHKGRYDFFYFATITTWLIVIILFLVYGIRMNRKLNINWNLAMMVYSVVTAFLLLLASSLVLDAVIEYRGKEGLDSHKNWLMYCELEKCGNIEAAGLVDN